MDTKEIMDALRVANHELLVGEEAIGVAQTKIQTLISQLQENLRTSGNIAGVAAHLNPPGEQITLPRPAKPALPSLDFSEDFSTVPQSAASRIPPEQLQNPTVKVPNSVAAAATQPTPERTGPTVERGLPTMTMEERKSEQLGHFMGTGSLFARFLSSEMIPSGKGMLKPKAPPSLEQYNEDASTTPIDVLASWPAGFYRNRATSERQLLLHTPRGMLLVKSLEHAHHQYPLAALTPYVPNQDWQLLTDVDLMDLVLLIAMAEKELQALTNHVKY